MARGDVGPLVERLESHIARAQDHAQKAAGPGVSRALVRDVSVISGVAVTMLGIKMLRLLPSIPFAPGHKLALLTPLYIAAGLLTKNRAGSTLTGVVMGMASFLMGADGGRYAIFEILKHVAPGIVCDLCLPLLTRAGRRPGGLAWSLLGGVIGVGRFATILCVTAAMAPPAVAFAFLLPGITLNVFFGVLSGYVSYHVARAIWAMQDRAAAAGETRRAKQGQRRRKRRHRAAENDLAARAAVDTVGRTE